MVFDCLVYISAGLKSGGGKQAMQYRRGTLEFRSPLHTDFV